MSFELAMIVALLGIPVSAFVLGYSVGIGKRFKETIQPQAEGKAGKESK